MLNGERHEAGGNLAPDSRWYVVYTRPHAEMRAAVQLNRQGFRTFLPLFEETIRHARQFRRALAPCFPRYLFVQLSLGKDRWRAVNGTLGVSRLLMDADLPRPVPAGLVEELLASSSPRGVLSLNLSLRPGQAVRIMNGPFAGIVARLAGRNVQGRIALLFEVFGNPTLVAFDASSVSLVPA